MVQTQLVVVDDTANTIKINSVDTNTQLSDGDVGAFGYIKGVDVG